MTTPRTHPKLPALAAAAVAAAVFAGSASGASAITLKAEHVDAMSATVLAAPNGHTLYRLKPETAHHLLCTSSACLGVWHPLTVKSKSSSVRLPKGAKGSATLLKRGHAYQVMVKGWPLYTFTGDSAAGQSGGNGLKAFGGTWQTFTVAKDAGAAPAPAPAPSPGYPY